MMNVTVVELVLIHRPGKTVFLMSVLCVMCVIVSLIVVCLSVLIGVTVIVLAGIAISNAKWMSVLDGITIAMGT